MLFWVGDRARRAGASRRDQQLLTHELVHAHEFPQSTESMLAPWDASQLESQVPLPQVMVPASHVDWPVHCTAQGALVGHCTCMS